MIKKIIEEKTLKNFSYIKCEMETQAHQWYCKSVLTYISTFVIFRDMELAKLFRKRDLTKNIYIKQITKLDNWKIKFETISHKINNQIHTKEKIIEVIQDPFLTFGRCKYIWISQMEFYK